MVRVGEWIEMKKMEENGDVKEIEIYKVKVKNLDKKIKKIKIRKIIKEKMKNYRGMKE